MHSKERAKVKNMVLALPFCIPTLTPKFQPQPPVFLHFSATKPLFLPIFHRKNTHSTHKKHTNTGISMSFAPASASAGCISVHDAGAVPSAIQVPAIHPAIGVGHCRHTKTDLTTIFLQQRYYAPPLIVQNMGASAINTAMFFQSLKHI